VVYGLGIWINVLRDLIGKLGNRLIRDEMEVRKGMIGSERGGDRVIGNYGMRREFEFLHTTSAL
jgi:hypothetical protein